MVPTIAAVTIGQAPRDETVAEIGALVPGARFVQAGALDGMERTAIAALAPRPGDFPLVTRLQTGETVLLDEARLAEPLQQAVDRVAGQADLVIVLCCGRFRLTARPPILLPGLLLAGVAGALYSGRTVAVFTPFEGQVALQETRWAASGVRPAVRHVSPYTTRHLDDAARAARADGAVAVLLDCMGYTRAIRARVEDAAGLPALLPRTLAGCLAAESLATANRLA